MLQRICIVISSPDSATINDAVKAMVQETPYAVWVLDDGSSTPVQDSLYSWDVRKAIETDRVRVIQQKDIARVIPELLGVGFTHMVTVAAQASLRAREVKNLVAEAEQFPFSIVMARLGNGELLPTFALYPLFYLQNFRSWNRVLPFLTSALAEARARGVDFRYIDVKLSAGEKPSSRFMRCQWGVASFIGGLFRPPRRAADRAMALAVGAAFGTLAFPMASVILSVLAAAVFRLRLTWIALSFGLTFYFFETFTWLGSIYIGQEIFHIDFLSGPEPHLRQLQVGSLALAPLVGGSVFIGARIMSWISAQVIKRSSFSFIEKRLRRCPDSLAKIALVLYFPFFVLRAGPPRRELKDFRRLWLAASFQMDRIRLEISFAPEAAYPGATLITVQIGNWPWLKGRAHILDAREEGAIEMIPFLGRLVTLDVSPFLKAAEDQTPVRFCYFIKNETGEYEWIVREPRLYKFSRNFPQELDAYIWARDFLADAEEILKRFPGQYLPREASGSKCPRDVRVKIWNESLNLLTGAEAAPNL